MIFNKLPYRISLNKARSWIMVFNCNMNVFSRLTSIINLYNGNMNLEMTIKKLGSIYKFRVCLTYFSFRPNREPQTLDWSYCERHPILVRKNQRILSTEMDFSK